RGGRVGQVDALEPRAGLRCMLLRRAVQYVDKGDIAALACERLDDPSADSRPTAGDQYFLAAQTGINGAVVVPLRQYPNPRCRPSWSVCRTRLRRTPALARRSWT